MIHERTDDLPLLLAEIYRMGLPELLDEYFPRHGNWDGMSLGELVAVWLTHILSESNHRLSHVEPWAMERFRTLSGCLGNAFRPQELADDRLAAGLRHLAKDAPWTAFEAALNARTLRAYDLEVTRVRLDSTTVSSHQAVQEGGLFQFGHSKDARQNLPILKLMTATLDPLGLPLVTTVLAGNHADDPLYVPAIQEVQRGVRAQGVLYVGDSKMGAFATRAWVAQSGNYYLCPLGEKQLPAAVLEALLLPVGTGDQTLLPLSWTRATGEKAIIAHGFELAEVLTDTVTEPPRPWTERRLLIRSVSQVEQAVTSQRQRVAKALAAVEELGVRRQGKRRYPELAALQAAVTKIVSRYQVDGLLRLTYQETTHTRLVHRRGATAPTEVVTREVSVTVARDAAACTAAEQRLGWRVYATNAPASALSLAAAVGAYREQYHIEHSFGRLKGRPLSLQPMYLARDDHATGLVRLLSLALRVHSVIEFQVQRALAARPEPLRGLYPGNPTRATRRPSSELLLRAFGQVTLTTHAVAGQPVRHLTPLKPLQQQILELLNLPPSIYTGLVDRKEEPG